MTESISDAEWAAGVMGWDWDESDAAGPAYDPKTGRCRVWNPDTDANDFRDLLNCEAVREFFCGLKPPVNVNPLLNYWGSAFGDQPAALRRLREAMERKA